MLHADDITLMASANLEIRDDNDVSVVIRRGSAALAAQSVRIVGKGTGSRRDSDAGQESRGGALAVGAAALDIQPEDRFTVSGVLYRVVYIQPNRTVSTIAEIEVVE